MAAPKGNQYYLIRSKDGREKKMNDIEIIKKFKKYKKQPLTHFSLKSFSEYLNISLNTLKNCNEISLIKDEIYKHNKSLVERGLLSQHYISFEKGKRKDYIQKEVLLNNELKINKRKTKIVNGHSISGYVYFLKVNNTDNLYKIGFSTNPKRRLRDIQASMPYDIQLLSLKQDLFALDVEQELLKKYSKYIIKGEWLKLEDDKVNKIINFLNQL